ncbi:MAG TPA: hypothetical protein VHO24_18015 [Opitutaceae bacterium]|nr:hypothetical protein [Opitutaceae bacterium]
MSSFPKLSYVCPIPWSTLTGDERRKFCEKCGLHVANLSEMGTAAREELLKRAETESVCVSFYRRLSGEYVTPDAPLTRDERSKIKPYGIAALSAAALAVAAGCASVSPSHKNDAPVARPAEAAAGKTSNDDVIILHAFGIVCAPLPEKR